MVDGVTLFRATLVPHRSLAPSGVVAVCCAIIAGSLAVNALFLALGAWPVAGFSGAEIGLAVLLLRRHARNHRATETILLTDRLATVIGAAGTLSLPTAWLRVDLEERAARVPALYLRERSRAIEVGSSLGEEDKRALAAAITGALARARSPLFDNPQLR